MSRRAELAGDLLAGLVLVGVALATWPHGMVAGVPAEPGAPAWATFQDALLDGPDAGRWAAQAQAFAAGAWERLDPHRMPSWTLATVGVGRLLELDLVYAGHLVNHLARLLLGPLVYTLARGLGVGRLGAVAAGLLAVVSPATLGPSRRYGVDVMVALAWPAGLVAARAAAFGAVPALFGGVVAGLVTLTHFTTLPAPVPLLLAAVLAARRGRRLEVAIAFVAGGTLTLAAVWAVFPAMEVPFLLQALVEGIAPAHLAPDGGGDATARAAAILDAGAPTAGAAAAGWVRDHALPAWLPAGVVPVLVLLGAAGPGLGWAGPGTEPSGGTTAVRRGVAAVVRGLTPALPVLLVLVPVPVLFAAGAPSRYVDTLAPVMGVLVVRGVAAGLGWVDDAARARWPGWPDLVAGGVAVALALAWATQDPIRYRPLPPPEQEIAVREAARWLAARFPAGVGVATLVPEVAVGAGAVPCPPRRVCPRGGEPADFLACLRILDEDCPGEGDHVWIVSARHPVDERTPARVAMDAWVAERWPAAAEWHGPELDLAIHAVPRGLGTPPAP